MKKFIVLIMLASLCGCSTPHEGGKPAAGAGAGPDKRQAASTGVEYSGGDGSSREDAVIIKAPDNSAGVKAEYAWIRKNHPTWRVLQQSLVNGEDGKIYDQLDYSVPDGEDGAIYFDITDFFGKW